VPLKFDEYGAVGECDEGARLDNFVIQLQNEPTSQGFIIGYDGRDTLPARLGRRLRRAADYLTYQRGLPPDRVTAVKGGYRETETTELWIAPKGAPAPEPSKTIVVERETGKTFKYDEFYPENAVVEYQEEPELPQQEEVTAGNESMVLQQEEIVSFQLSPVEESAPAQEVIVEDQEEADYDLLWASEHYAQALGEKDVACVIYYAQREGGHLFKLERIIERGQNLITGKYGIQAERLKTIFGGYRDYTTIELWVVPPGAGAPVPAPGYEKGETGEEASAEVKE
jgi:hypothetical protein